MVKLAKAALAVFVLSTVALSGCGVVGSAAERSTRSVIELLRTDPEASMRTAVQRSQKVKSVALVMSGTVSKQRIQAHAVVAFGPPSAAEMTVSVAGQGEVTMRLLGTVAYTQLPAAARARVGGKTWLKADIGELAKRSGSDVGGTSDMLSDMEPSLQLKQLAAAGDFKVNGEEEIDGVKTVRYTGTISVEKYLKSVRAGRRTALDETLKQAGVTKIYVDAWVDERYQLRRAHQRVGGVTDITVTYSDYDKPVTVVAPPANETADLAALLKQAHGVQS